MTVTTITPAPAVEQDQRPERLAVVMPHREAGHWICGRWYFYCTLCRARTGCIFHWPSTAGDWARRHLSDAHEVGDAP
jgi:hypothetical protein